MRGLQAAPPTGSQGRMSSYQSTGPEGTDPDAALRISADGIAGADGHTLVRLSGVLTSPACTALRYRLNPLLDAGRARLVVDLRRLELVHPAGLAVLVGARRRAQQRDGCLHVVSDADPAFRALRRTGTYRVLRATPTVDAATRACRSAG